MRSETLGVSDLSISTVVDGKEALSKIEKVLKIVKEQQQTLEKKQNNFDFTISSLSTSKVDLLTQVLEEPKI